MNAKADTACKNNKVKKTEQENADMEEQLKKKDREMQEEVEKAKREKDVEKQKELAEQKKQWEKEKKDRLDIMKKQLEADRKELEKANAHQRNMEALKNAFATALGVVSSGVMMGIAAGTAALGVVTENPAILYLSAQIASHVFNRATGDREGQ